MQAKVLKEGDRVEIIYHSGFFGGLASGYGTVVGVIGSSRVTIRHDSYLPNSVWDFPNSSLRYIPSKNIIGGELL